MVLCKQLFINLIFRLNSICEKPPLEDPTSNPIEELCTDTSCCNSHIGAEYGGILPKQAFSASSQLNKNGRPEAGRLNNPNKLLQIADINILNDMLGGWLPEIGEVKPWWQTAFMDENKDVFIASVKGVITQGLDGYHDRYDAKRWVKTFNVRY